MQILNVRRGSKAWVFPELEPVSSEPTVRLGHRGATRSRETDRGATTSLDAQVQATVVHFKNLQTYGNLLVNFMEARKRVFIDHRGWDLPQVDGMEFDQYDTPEARWVIIHSNGETLGGVRLTPTTAQVGIYSYMLRDAQRGLLPDIPTDALFLNAPVDPSVWEASRLFITEDVPAPKRLEVQSVLMENLAKGARDVGATHVIGIVPAVFSRWLRRLGLDAVPVGRRFETDGMRSQAAIFKVAVTSN